MRNYLTTIDLRATPVCYDGVALSSIFESSADFLIHSPNLDPRTALLTLGLESAEVQRNRYLINHKGSEFSNMYELARLRSPNTLEV